MIERINQYAAENFGGVGTTRASLVRIHAWILVFLVIVSALAPKHGDNRRVRALFAPVQSLSLGPTDQRAFAPSAFEKNDFHIAWIYGSEGDVVDGKGKFPSQLGSFLLPSLPEIDHRKVVVDTYNLLGMEVGDVYMTLLDALATKPDLVIVSMNPILVMNPYALHQWSNLDPRAAVELATRPAKWPIGAALLSPSDLLWGVTESHLTPFTDRSYWSTWVHSNFDSFGPLDRSQLRQSSLARSPDRSQQLVGLQPLAFWAEYRLHLTVGGPGPWAGWVNAGNRGDNQFNAVLVRAIGAALRAAGTPSIVYLAQANSTWLATNKSFADSIAGVERQLSALSGAFRADNVLYQPQNLSSFVSGLVFWDETHLSNAGTLGPYFASQVCRVLAQVGRGADCHPVVEGSKP